MANLKTSFEISVDTSLRNFIASAATGYLIGDSIGMAKIGATLGAALGTARVKVKVSSDIVLKGNHGENPYLYVSKFHKEVFLNTG